MDKLPKLNETKLNSPKIVATTDGFFATMNGLATTFFGTQTQFFATIASIASIAFNAF